MNFTDISSEKYKKIFKIGSGTFGEAWLVNSLCSGRSYVMKEVKVGDLSEDELEKTQREAAVLSRCKHVNIIRYKESFLTTNPLKMCLVMEYADGGDLSEKVNQAKILKKLIPEQSILHWFIQIIFAVQYLHKNNILHRDLKTQNIFLTHQNLVKVGDFGIARFLRNKQELATTAVGTPFYLSPEICLRKPYDHRSDMWSVGCLLYELCALKHPFEANDFENLVLQILRGNYGQLSSTYSHLIHDLVEVLLRKNPSKRPSTDEILIIPALRLVVQDYINTHIANLPLNKNSPTFVTSPLNSKSKRFFSEKDSQQLCGREDGNITEVCQFSPSECGQKTDSQTQTPPEWCKTYYRHLHASPHLKSSAPPCQKSSDRESKIAVVAPVKECVQKESNIIHQDECIEHECSSLKKTYTVTPQCVQTLEGIQK